MARLLLVLCIIAVIVVHTHQEPQKPKRQRCKGRNQIWSECRACDKSCKNPNPVCAAVCIPGCQCVRGYVRNDEGRCIKPKYCPKDPKDGNVTPVPEEREGKEQKG